MNTVNIPNELKEAIKNNKIILFVGSGVSLDLGMPSWNELVKNIIDDIVQKTGNTDLDMLKDILTQGVMDAIDILELIEKKKYRKYAFNYIEKNLRLNDNAKLDLHKKLFEFCPRIITTNYDHAFERATEDKVSIINNDSINGLTNLSNKEEYILKIHGDVNDPEKCILFKSDYDKLYNDKTGLFMSQLKNCVLNKTLIFIGFSFNDPYIKEIMDHINMITNGMMNNHYLFTTDQNFQVPYIKPIVLEKYSDLSSVIDKLLEIHIVKSGFKKSIDNKKLDQQVKTPIFHLLKSSPIDKDYNFNVEFFQRSFNNYKVKLRSSALSLDEIRNCEDGYLILFTKIIKGNIIIEDEYLTSRQISIFNLLDNLSEKISGLIIFVNELPQIDNSEYKIPCLFILEENKTKIKRRIDTILYKISSNKTDFSSHNDLKIGQQDFKRLKLVKGKPDIINEKLKISRYVDKKLLTNFVGRKTDIENIVRKIINLEYENKLLTIKGSGGIGKTTIIIKVVLELVERGLFDRVEYISCQSISTYENLSYQVLNFFNIDSAINFDDRLKEVTAYEKIILVFDNFETLLQLDEKDRILDLISNLCDHCLIITTSRQILDLDYEELYELRNLTTDEGVKVFKNYYKGRIKENEEDMLRYDIVENLLNNNPLAIKIISKGIPKSKDINTLKDELKYNIFNNENINKIFENPEDINIEKSNSLFYSIKYSYDKLNHNEKFAFELLSLFPDGIHIENFKKFAKQNKDSFVRITDREIKSLDDKSLLENSSGFLKLQSIINRFSNHQFIQRSELDKTKYYTLCFEYNSFVVNFLDYALDFSQSLKIHDDNINNYLECLKVLKFVDKDNLEKLKFISSISKLFIQINQYEEFINKISTLEFKSVFIERKELNFLEVIKLRTIFWCKDFKFASDKIREKFNQVEMSNLNMDIEIDRMIYNKIQNIKTLEGESLSYLVDVIDRWHLETTILYALFKVGLIKLAYSLLQHYNNKGDESFGDYEIMLANDSISINDLNNYIKQLYKKETLEIIQVHYIKIKLDSSQQIDTSSFIVSNPYTEGIILLINAISSVDDEEKHSLFTTAINKLEHIKYYYVEAIYYYCLFLQEISNHKLFDKYFEIGISNSIRYNYNYLEFQFLKLKDNSLIYDEEVVYSKFPNITKETFDLFIDQHIKELKKLR